jgi:hypothetical protein
MKADRTTQATKSLTSTPSEDSSALRDKDNPAVQRALRRLRESQEQVTHMAHHTKHSSHSTHSKSVW